MKSSVVILSGGLDSTVLLYKTFWEVGAAVRALSFDYGQRHHIELQHAKAIADRIGIPHQIVDLHALRDLLGGSALTGDCAVPEGHYEDESMKKTVVPNRNMIMLSIAAGHAMAIGFDQVAYAAHGGDHAIYPDCRPQFANAMAATLQLADWKTVTLYTPFIHATKAEIVAEGARYGVPFHMTWSCYQGGEFHCGKCGTCVERIEAFKLAGVKDPTVYAERAA